ncbi:tetratricopeptide repeat protein [bacterium]|nr:tetratricopeptide repeat protein [bacterium]
MNRAISNRAIASTPVILLALLLLTLIGCADSQEARKQYEKGRQLGKQGRTDEAIALFNKAIEVDPNYAEAHNGLGFAYLLKGEDDMGEREIKEALRLKPDFSKAIRNLAILYLRQKRMNEAMPLWKQLTEIKPDDAKAWSYLSAVYMSVRQIEKALVASKRALELSPNDPGILLNNASICTQLVKLDEAEQFYKRLVEMMPPDDSIRKKSFLGLFDVYFLQGDSPKARVIALKAKEQFPDDSEVYYRFGLLNERLEKNEQAAKDFEKAMALDPVNAALMNKVATFYTSIGKSDRSTEIYRKCIETAPRYMNAYIGLASLAIERKEGLDEAESVVEKALSFADSSQRPRLLDQMSFLKRLQGDLESAMKYANEAFDCIPKGDKLSEAAIRIHRAQIHKANGDMASVKADLESALRLDPPEALIEEIERVASDLPPEWTPKYEPAKKSEDQSSNQGN